MRVTLRQWRQMRSWWGMLQNQLVSRLQNGRRWNNPRTWFLRSRRSSARAPAPSRQAFFETFEPRQCFAIDPLISGPPLIQLGEPYILTLESQGDPAARWEVDWGDGSEIQQVAVPSGQSSLTITHAFEVAQNQYQIAAQAFDEYNVGFLASSAAQVGLASASNLNWTSPAASSRGDLTVVLTDGSLVLLQVRDNQLTLYKINAAGEIDTTFGNAGSTILEQSALDENYLPRLLTDTTGKLYVAWRNTGNSSVARFLSDGTLDTNYGANGYLNIGATLAKQPLALDATGRLLVAGNLGTQPTITRYLSNGQLDPTFGSTGSLTINNTATAVDLECGLDGSLRLLANASGNLLIWKYARNSNNNLVLSSPTSLDLGGTENATEMRLLTEGGVLVAGKSLSGTQPSIFVVKYRADGTKDPNFGSSGVLTKAIATTDANLLLGNLRVLASGQVVLSGSYRAAGNVLHQGFWSIDPRGQWDTALNPAAWSDWNGALPTGSQVRDLQITSAGDVIWTGSAVSGSVTTSFVQRSSPALQNDPLLVYVHRDPVTASIELPDRVSWGSEFSAQLSSLNTLPGEIAQWEITWAPGVVENVAGNSTLVNHRYPVTSLNQYSQSLSVSAVAVLTNGQRISTPAQSVLLLSYIRPTVSISGPTQAIAGDIYTLSLNINRPTPVSPVQRWEINWGDGSEPQSIAGNPSAATHVFTRGGETYLVRATAFDAEGAYSTNWLIGAPLQADANFAQDGHGIQISIGANAKAQALTRTAQGELLVGGVADGHLLLLKYHQTGELTQAFGTAGIADLALPTTWSATQVLQAKELASGEIQVFGKTMIAGAARYFTIRCDLFGTPVSDYGSNGILLLDNTTLRGPAVQLANGSLLALGLAANGETILWAYNAAGQLDTGKFPLGQVNLGWVTTAVPDATVPQALLVDDQGRIIIAMSQSANLRLTRLLSNGSFDLTFSDDGRESYPLAGLSTGERQIVLGFQPGTGDLIVGLTYSGNLIRVISYNTAGVLSSTWGTSGITHAELGFSNVKLTGLQFNADGDVYLGVQAGTAADRSMMLLIANNGYYQYATELTIGSGTVGQYAAFLVNPQDNTFYISGRGKNLDDVAGFAVSRFLGLNAQQSNALANYTVFPNPEGLSWQDLHAQANDTLLGTALRVVTQSDGKLLVFGKRFDQQIFVTRMNSMMEVDYSFGSAGTLLLGFHELVDAELTPSGRLVVVGQAPEWGYLGTGYGIGYYSWDTDFGYGYGYEYDLGYGYLPGVETLVVDWITPEGYLEATSGPSSFQLLSHNTAVLNDGSVIVAVNDGNGQPNLIKYMLDPEQSGYLTLDPAFSINGHANLQSFINGYNSSTALGNVSLQKIGQSDFLVALSVENKLYVAKFHADGSLDESFAGMSQPLTITNLTNLDTIKFLLEPTGQFTLGINDSLHATGQSPLLIVVRYNTDGTHDAAFNGPSGYRWTETGSWAPLISMLRDAQGTIQFVFGNGSYITYNPELTFFSPRSTPYSAVLSDEAISLNAEGNFLIPTAGNIGYYDIWVDDGYGYTFVPRPDWDPGYGGSSSGYGYGYGNGYGYGYGNSNGYGYGYVPGYGFGYFEWQYLSHTETVFLQGPMLELARGPLSGHRVTVADRPLNFSATIPSTLVLGHQYNLDLTVLDYRGERVSAENWTLSINSDYQLEFGNTSAIDFTVPDWFQAPEACEIQLRATIQGREYTWNYSRTLLPNHAPTIAAVDPLTIAQGRSLTLPISASDEDPGDKLTFQLDSSAPVGASINAQTGALSWYLGADVAPGTYEFQVLVSDRASTPLTTSQTINVTVLETTGTIAPRNTVPVIAVLDLLEDTGDPSDFQSRNATLKIEFNADLTPFENSEYLVELDWNLDGVVDGSIEVDSALEPQLVDWSEVYPGLSYGFVTVGVRVHETIPDRALVEGRETIGEWKWLSFRYDAPAPELFAIGNIALAEPLVNQENSTSKPILTGQVLAAVGISVSVEYDLNNDGAADGTVFSDPVTGVFTIDLTQQIYRSGQVPLAVRVSRYDFATAGTVSGAWQSATFSYAAPTLETGITGVIDINSPQTTGAGSTVVGNPGIVAMDISLMIPNWNIALLQNMGLYERPTLPVPEYSDRFLVPLSSQVIVSQNGLDGWTETYSVNTLYNTYSITRQRDALDFLQVDNVDDYLSGYGNGSREINYTQQYQLQYRLYSFSTGGLIYSESRNIVETGSFAGIYYGDHSTYTQTVNRTENFTYSPDIFVNVVGQTLLPGARYRGGTQSYTATSDGTRTWDWNSSEAKQLENTTYASQGTTNYWDSTDSYEGYVSSNEYRNGNYQFAFNAERDRAETISLPDVSYFYTAPGTSVSSSEDTVYVADVTQNEYYRNNNYQYNPIYQSSPGFARSAGSSTTLNTRGTQTHQYTMVGQDHVANDQPAVATLAYSGQRIMVDQLNQQTSRWDNVTSNSDSNVTFSSQLTESYNNKTDRTLLSLDHKLLTFTDFVRDDYAEHEHQSLTTTSNWTSAAKSEQRGTDKSQIGIQSFYLANSQSDDIGSQSVSATADRDVRLNADTNFDQGKQYSQEQRSSQTKWANSSQSGNDAQSYTEPGILAHSKSRANESNTGNGNTTYQSSFQTETDHNKTTSSRGTTNYTTNSQGSTNGSSQNESSLRGKREPYPGVIEIVDNSDHSEETYRSQYQNKIQGRGSYHDSDEILNERTDSRETGKSSGSSDAIQKFQSDNNASENFSAQRQDVSKQSSKFTAKFQREYLGDLTTSRLNGSELLTGTESTKTSDERKETYTSKSDSHSHQVEKRAIRDGVKNDHRSETTTNSSAEKSGKNQSAGKTESQTTYTAEGTSYSNTEDSKFADKYEFSDKYDSDSSWEDNSVLKVTTTNHETASRDNSNGKGESTITTHSEESREVQNPVVTSSWRETKSLETNDTASETKREYNSATHEDETVKIPQTDNGNRSFSEETKFHEESTGDTKAETQSKTTSSSLDGDTSYFLSESKRQEDVQWTQESKANETKYDSDNSTTEYDQEDTTENKSQSSGQEQRTNEAFAETSSSSNSEGYTSAEKRVNSSKVEDGQRHAQSESTSSYYRWDDDHKGIQRLNQTQIKGKDESDSDYSSSDYDSYERIDDDVTTLVSSLVDSTGSGKSDYQTQRRIATINHSDDGTTKREATNILDIKNTDKGTFTTNLHDFWETLDGAKEAERTFTRYEEGTYSRTEKETTDGASKPSKDSAFSEEESGGGGEGEGTPWAKTWNYNTGAKSVVYTEFNELRDSAINDGTYTFNVNEESWSKRDKSSMSSDSSSRTENSEDVSRSSFSDSKTQAFTFADTNVYISDDFESLKEIEDVTTKDAIRNRLVEGQIAYYAEISHSETALTGGKITTTSGQSNYTHSNFKEAPTNQNIVESSSSFDEQGKASTSSTKEYMSLGISDTFDTEANHFVDKSASSTKGSETEKHGHLSKIYTSDFTQSSITDDKSNSWNQKIDQSSTVDGQNEWTSSSTSHSFGWKHDFGKTDIKFDQAELSKFRDYSVTDTKGNSSSSDKGTGTYKSDADWTTTNNVKNGTETSNRTGKGSFERTTHSELETKETARPTDDLVGGKGRRSSNTNSNSDTTDKGTYTSEADTSSSISSQDIHDDSSSSKREDKGSRTEDQTTKLTDGKINYRGKYAGEPHVKNDESTAEFDSTNITHDETTEYTLTFSTASANGQKLDENESLVSYNIGSENTEYTGKGTTTYERSNNSKSNSLFVTDLDAQWNSEKNETINNTTDKGEINYEDTSVTIKDTVTGQSGSGRHSTGTGTSHTTDYTKASKNIAVKHRTLPPASLTPAGQLYDLANFAIDVLDGKIDRDDYETTYNDSAFTKQNNGDVDISYDLTETELSSGTTKTGTVTHKTKYNETTTDTTGSGSTHLTTTKFVNTLFNKEELTKLENKNYDTRTSTKVGDGTKKVTKTYFEGKTDPTTTTKEAAGKGNVTSDRTVYTMSSKQYDNIELDGVSTYYKLEFSEKSEKTGQKAEANLDKESSKLVNKVTTTTEINENTSLDFIEHNPGHDDGYGNIEGYYHLEQHDSTNNHKIDTDTFESKGSLSSELFDRAADVLDFITDPFDLVEDIPEISNYEYQRTINRVEHNKTDELRWFDDKSVNQRDKTMYFYWNDSIPIWREGHAETKLDRTEKRYWDESTSIAVSQNKNSTFDVKNLTLSGDEYQKLHTETHHTLDSYVELNGPYMHTENFSEEMFASRQENHYLLEPGQDPYSSNPYEFTSITGTLGEDGSIEFRNELDQVITYNSSAFVHEFSLGLGSHVWQTTVNAAKNLGQTAREAFRSVFDAAANTSPRADYEFELRSFEQKLEWYIDATIGVVDNLLEAINPLSSVFEIPNIGAKFGNEDAYAKGAFWGNVLGVGVSIASGFGALGLGVGCGSQLQTLSKLWNAADTFNTFVSVGKAVNNFSNGNASWGDALDIASAALGPSIAAYGKMKGWSGCFVAGTPVLIPLPPELALAFEPIQTETGQGFFGNTTLILVMAGIPLVLVAKRRKAFLSAPLPKPRLPANVRRFFGSWDDFDPELARLDDDLDWIEEPHQGYAQHELLEEDFMFRSVRQDERFEQYENDENEQEDDHENCLAEPTGSNLRLPASELLLASATLAPTALESKSAVAEESSISTMPASKSNSLAARPGFWRSCVAAWALLLALFAGGYFLTGANGDYAAQAAATNAGKPKLGNWTNPATGQSVPYTSQSIEALRVGQRVIADDPDADVTSTTQVDPATWNQIRISAVSVWEDGTVDKFHIVTLQPPKWIELNEAHVGAEVPLPLDLGDLDEDENLRGRVEAIDACPPIQAGPGRVVLTTVTHLNAAIHELRIRNATGQEATVVTTRFHKFYRLAEHAWVSAETLATADKVGGVIDDLTILANTRLPGTRRVYNMTVEGEHVYYVSELGLLAHNSACGDPNLVAGPNPNKLRQRAVDTATSGEGGVYLKVQDGKTKIGSTGEYRTRYNPNAADGIEVEIPQTRFEKMEGVDDSAYKWNAQRQRRFDEEYVDRITPKDVRYRAEAPKSPVSQSKWDQFRHIFGYGDLPSNF